MSDLSLSRLKNIQTMEIAVLKYNAGNIKSVLNALRRLGVNPVYTDDKETLKKADKVIFPGQGNALTAMNYLRQKGLDKLIVGLKQPVLGICVGQQLLCSHSEEGPTDCLGVFPLPVMRFQPTRHTDKVPAMGWQQIDIVEDPLLDGLPYSAYCYFVHSFYVPLSEYTIATANYILPYSAALHKDNFYATQFHPEKSGSIGETILRNFIEL